MPTQYNAHTHCFTLKHVPEEFFFSFGPLGKILRISKLQNKHSFNRWFANVITRNWIITIVGIFSKVRAGDIRRLKGLLKYEDISQQSGMIDELGKVYGSDVGFILLTMDMDEIAAGKASVPFLQQLEELQKEKGSVTYADKVFPFIFADPRRIGISDIVKKYINDNTAPFSGIKIYPAIGYYPFHKNMKIVYEFAITKNLPLITHCINGVVYYRNELQKDPDFLYHPITNIATLKGSPSVFQVNFTHPLNYECLMNQEILKKYWGEDAPDLKSLKLCIGHFGGADEWNMANRQKNMLQGSRYKNLKKIRKDPLDIYQPWFGKSGQRLSWFTIIKALLEKYQNLYADISFTLAEDKFHFDQLKTLLQDPVINKRILFGTDFYVVSTIKPEAEIWELLHSKMTPAEIDMLTKTNPANFLNPEVNYYRN